MSHINEIQIRNAKHSDIEIIENIIEGGYRREIARKGWTHEVDLLQGERLAKGEIKATLENIDSRLFVAIDQFDIVQGVICVSRNGDWVEFGKFAVNPEIQNNGIGKKLISHVEEFVKTQWNKNNLLLSVLSQRLELIEYYKRLGFKETGQRQDFLKMHPYVILKDGVENLEVLIMSKPL